MGRLTIAYLLLCIATSAAAFPVSPAERAQAFATCAGRYSALVEHQRLFDGVLSEQTVERRNTFVLLLESVLPHALEYGLPDTQAMAWRVEAKAQHQRLLSNAVFGIVPERARPARAAAEDHLARCDALLLGS